MGGLCYERSGKSGRRMENNSKRQKELETGDREKKTKKKTMITMAYLAPAKRGTTIFI